MGQMTANLNKKVDILRERLPAGTAILMLVLLGLTYSINAADRQLFPILVPKIDAIFHFSLPQGGLLATIFTLGVGISGIPAGYLIERLTRKHVIVFGILAFSVFTVLTAVSTGFSDMAVWRFGSGLGEGIQNVALYSAVGTYFYRRRTMALGAMSLAYGFGGYFGPALGSKLMVASGWQTPLYVYGALGLVFALIVGLVISHRFTQQGAIEEADARSLDDTHLSEGLWNKNLVLGLILAIISGVLLYEYIGLYPTFLIKDLHFSPVLTGGAFSMFGVGAGVAGIPAGYLGDRFRQKWVIVLGFLSTAVVGYIIFSVVRSSSAQFLFSFLEGALCSSWLYCNIYSFCQRSVRKSFVGRASGIYVIGYYLPAGVSGYIFGRFVQAVGWAQAGVYLISLLALVGLVIALFIDGNALLAVKENRA